MSPLEVWWTWTKASAELSDEPIPRDAVVLSGSFPGASVMVTAGNLDEFIAEHIKMKRVIYQLWNAPDDAYTVEGDVYSILGPPKPYRRTRFCTACGAAVLWGRLVPVEYHDCKLPNAGWRDTPFTR